MNKDQIDYYCKTAAEYDSRHLTDGDAHSVALEIMSRISIGMGFTSFLDVGSGTGRGLSHLHTVDPNMKLVGMEPSSELIKVAQSKKELVDCEFVRGVGETMPFADRTFDVVFSTGVLHHVADPLAVVSEMTRVCRNSLFISDSNMYGRGSALARIAKNISGAFGLTNAAQWIRHGGSTWIQTDGDGISKAFSVFDVLGYLDSHFDRVLIVPSGGGNLGRRVPLFAADHIFALAFGRQSHANANTG